jgi:cation transport regulator ChaC
MLEALTMPLQDHVWGMCYEIEAHNVADVLAYLDYREKVRLPWSSSSGAADSTSRADTHELRSMFMMVLDRAPQFYEMFYYTQRRRPTRTSLGLLTVRNRAVPFLSFVCTLAPNWLL